MGFLGISPVHADSQPVLYGTFFYVWYPSHFNGIPPSPLPRTWWTCPDVPLMGYYYSNESSIIKEQIIFMHNAGINFVLISWWNDSETDNAMRQVFETVSQLPFSIKLAISVEPINESGTYDFPLIMDYIYNTYVEPYRSIYMTLDDKPLLTWMQGGTMTNPQANQIAIHNDSRFESRIIGDMDYVDWYWWFPNNEHPEQHDPKLETRLDGGETTIEPRYDDSRLGLDPFSGEVRNTTDDPDYSEGQYQVQWDIANDWIKKGQCHIILIGTWNDYTERTQIEPCFDSTSKFSDNPFYLLKITRQNILGVTSSPTNPNVWLPIVSGVLGAIIASGIVSYYFLKIRKKS